MRELRLQALSISVATSLCISVSLCLSASLFLFPLSQVPFVYLNFFLVLI